MIRTIDKYFPVLVALTGIATLVALYLIFFYAPVEVSMGIVQKILYIHVPSAMVMYAGFIITSVASLVYLIKPSRGWDIAAVSGVEIGMLFCVFVLISGPLWGYKAWGEPWVWDPQLTATFVLFLLYGGYALLRIFSANSDPIRKAAAVLAVIAVVDIPIIHYAVQRWGGQHPAVERSGGGGMAAGMKVTAVVSMIAFLGIFLVVFWLRMRVRLSQRKLDRLYLDVEDADHVLAAGNDDV